MDSFKPLCDIVAATDVATVYTEWQCNSSGYPLTDPCTPNWNGVICNWLFAEQKYITEITLFAAGISGTVPSSIGEISSLIYLLMSNNKLYSTLPITIGKLTNLITLQMASNGFTGQLPMEISNLTQLYILDLQDNYFSKSLPSSIGTLPHLSYLLLSQNCFSGFLPQETSPELINYLADSNSFVGTLPTSLGNLRNADFVKFHDNYLEGTIPSEIGVAVKMEIFQIQNNYIRTYSNAL
jgi:hypothetical protein